MVLKERSESFVATCWESCHDDVDGDIQNVVDDGKSVSVTQISLGSLWCLVLEPSMTLVGLKRGAVGNTSW